MRRLGRGPSFEPRPIVVVKWCSLVLESSLLLSKHRAFRCLVDGPGFWSKAQQHAALGGPSPGLEAACSAPTRAVEMTEFKAGSHHGDRDEHGGLLWGGESWGAPEGWRKEGNHRPLGGAVWAEAWARRERGAAGPGRPQSRGRRQGATTKEAEALQGETMREDTPPPARLTAWNLLHTLIQKRGGWDGGRGRCLSFVPVWEVAARV